MTHNWSIISYSSAAYIDSKLKNKPKIKVGRVFRVQNKQVEESFALYLQHLAGDELENLDEIKYERVWHGAYYYIEPYQSVTNAFMTNGHCLVSF